MNPALQNILESIKNVINMLAGMFLASIDIKDSFTVLIFPGHTKYL